MEDCRGIDANLSSFEREAERAERASAGFCAWPGCGHSSPLSGCCSRLASSCDTSNASAASTTAHRPSRGPPRPAQRVSICERFFFEELCTCLGEEPASQWLLKNQLSRRVSAPLTDEHRSPPLSLMRRSVTLGNLQAEGDAAAHAPVDVIHGKCDSLPLIGQAGGGVCRGAGDVVSRLAWARARVQDAASVGLMFTDAAHLVLGPRTPSE